MEREQKIKEERKEEGINERENMKKTKQNTPRWT